MCHYQYPWHNFGLVHQQAWRVRPVCVVPRRGQRVSKYGSMSSRERRLMSMSREHDGKTQNHVPCAVNFLNIWEKSIRSGALSTRIEMKPRTSRASPSCLCRIFIDSTSQLIFIGTQKCILVSLHQEHQLRQPCLTLILTRSHGLLRMAVLAMMMNWLVHGNSWTSTRL